MQAKQLELQNWHKHKMYNKVKDNDQRVISVWWVITQRYKGNKMTYKVCLVARGFEEENLQEIHLLPARTIFV